MIDNKENIKFSIIVPCYNVERYIEECVNSVIHQTYSNWELLLVNDASNDDTLFIIKNLELKDKRIKVFDKEHGGLPHTRNYGLKHVTGDYLMLLDGDDYFSVNHLKNTFDILRDHNFDMLIYNQHTLFTEEAKSPYILFNEYNGDSDNTNKIRHIFAREKSLPAAAVLTTYNMSFINKYNLSYTESYSCSEDLDFFLQAISKKPNINFAYYEFYFYRQDNLSAMTKNITAQMELDRISIYKKWFDFFGAHTSSYDYSDAVQKKLANDLRAQIYVSKNIEPGSEKLICFFRKNRYILRKNGLSGTFFYAYYVEEILGILIKLKNILKNILWRENGL